MATAIGNTPSGNLSSTTVQAALNELQGDCNTNASSISDHINATSQAHSSTAISHITYHHGDPEQPGLTTVAGQIAILDLIGQPHGLPYLAEDGKIPSTFLPSYVDDVLEYNNLAAFPATGESSKIFVALDTNKTYRWSGSAYIEISPSAVNSVNGQTGAVVLNKSDVGLGNVDNTSDATKNSAVAVLTNKDFDGGTASNTSRVTLPKDTLSNITALTRKEGTVIYGTDTDKVYYDDGATLTPIGSGGAGSPSIYVTLKSDEDSGTWLTGDSSTFLGGGTLSGSFDKQNATNPLNGTYSYVYTQAAGSQDDYLASPLQPVPLRARGNTNRCKLVYTYDGNDNDIKAVIYDATNSAILSASTSYIKTSSVGKQFEILFDVPATCVNIRVGFHVMVANSGKVLKFDDIQVSDEAFSVANLVEQEGAVYYGNAGGSNVSPNGVEFSTLRNSTLKNLGTWSGSVFTAKKKSLVSITANVRLGNSYTGFAYIYVNRGGTDTYLALTPNPVSASTSMGVSGSVELNPGDTLRVVLSNTNNLLNSVDHIISITATAVSENIIQSWQPSDCIGEIKYLPQNVAPQGFLPANGSIIGLSSGSHQGNTYYDLYNVLWNVAQTTAGEPYVISSAKGASASADWSAGKTITIDESGLFTRAYKSGTSGAVGAKQLDAFQDHTHSTPYRAIAGTSGLYGLGGGSTTEASTGVASTGRTSSETRPTNVAKYAFIRYATAQPTLLALPTSKENTFSARITSAGGILSQSTDWINSVTLSNTSVFTIDITKLGLTKAPAITGIDVTVTSFGTSSTRNIVIDSISPTTIVAKTGITDANGTIVAAALDFSITIQKQSPDYTSPGVFVGTVQPDWQYDLTVTGTDWTTTRAVGVVYKCGGGQYRMRFNIVGSVTSGTRTSFTANISGVTFSTNGLPVSSMVILGGAFTICLGYTGQSNNQLTAVHSSGTTTDYRFSGDVELANKPAFATQTN